MLVICLNSIYNSALKNYIKNKNCTTNKSSIYFVNTTSKLYLICLKQIEIKIEK